MRMPANYKSVMQGKHNKAAGKLFETIISRSCVWYAQQGLAKIEKQAEPMRPLKPLSNGQFIACYESKAGADYKGTLQGGRAVVFEAKHTETDIFRREVVKEWQLEYLMEHQKLGAECFVLLSYGLQNFYRIPANDWYCMREKFGRVSLKEEHIKDYKIRFDGQHIRFLEGILDGADLWIKMGSD